MILRNVFSSGLFGADEIWRHLVLWMGLLGASPATREKRYLLVDVFSRMSSTRYQPWFDAVSNLMAMVG